MKTFKLSIILSLVIGLFIPITSVLANEEVEETKLGTPLTLDSSKQTKIEPTADNLVEITQVGEYNYDHARQVVKLINIERIKVGVDPVEMDDELLHAAMTRSKELLVLFSHARPDGSSCFDLAPKAQGENIAVGHVSPEAVVADWMESPGHKSNILNSKWKSIGIGVTNGVKNWTQLFSTQSSSKDSNKTGSVSFTEKTKVKESYIEFYAYKFDDRTNIYFMLTGHTGEFRYGIKTIDGLATYATIHPNDVIFKSSNPSVASIQSDGHYKALKAGQTTLSIQLKIKPTEIFYEPITVKEAGLKIIDDFGDTDNVVVVYRTGNINEPSDLFPGGYKNHYFLKINLNNFGITDWESKDLTWSMKSAGDFPNTLSYATISSGSNKIIAKKSGVIQLTASYYGNKSSIYIVIPGDLSRDGVLNTLDAIRIQKYASDKTHNLNNLGKVDTFTTHLADLNGDKKVNTLDKIVIQKMVSKIIIPSN